MEGRGSAARGGAGGPPSARPRGLDPQLLLAPGPLLPTFPRKEPPSLKAPGGIHCPRGAACRLWLTDQYTSKTPCFQVGCLQGAQGDQSGPAEYLCLWALRECQCDRSRGALQGTAWGTGKAGLARANRASAADHRWQKVLCYSLSWNLGWAAWQVSQVMFWNFPGQALRSPGLSEFSPWEF